MLVETPARDAGNLTFRCFEAQVFPVPSELAPWVQHVWVNRPTSSSASYRFHRAPEVATHLTFSIGSFSPEPNGRTLVNSARIALSGVQTHLYPVPFPVAEALVLQLRPGAARALRLPVQAMANEVVEVEQICGAWARELTERVAVEDRTEQRVSQLCELLARQFRKLDADGQLVRRAGNFSAACAAHERTHDLARRVGYSERQLRRVFTDLFGLNPKELSRVLRMNAVLRSLDETRDWADLALQHRYHDQSHLIHEFRVLIGQTPERFARTLAEPRLLRRDVVVTSARARVEAGV